MISVTLTLDPAVVRFYHRIALSCGRTVEQVMADALFKLAAELSLEALNQGE